jgi:hypothetical protein
VIACARPMAHPILTMTRVLAEPEFAVQPRKLA